MSDHDHDHDHDHDGHEHAHYETPTSRRARSQLEVRTMALEAALVERGVISAEAVDAFVEILESRMGPHHGARVVARAWIDSEFKERLITDGTAAMAELGIAGAEGDTVRVLENTPDVHNLVVCTLCSCYPWPLLGLPPIWYKSFAYRSRAVTEPRAVLGEFGTTLDPGVDVRVWDSSAGVRYLVLPMRPTGTDALSEDQLAALVTRDSMVGATVLVAS